MKKAKKNVSEFGYLSKLDFYISQKITKSKKNQLIRQAEIEYNIDLKIIDANKLAEDANEYDSIKKTIHGIYKFPQQSDILKIDKQTKVLFDILAIGKDISKIKNQFIFSFILFYLFSHPSSTDEQVYCYLKDKLSEKYDLNFYTNRLNDLKSKKIIETPKDKKHFSLTDDSYKKIKDILEIAESQEALLIQNVKDFLVKYGIEDYLSELIQLLHNIYIENYRIDIDEINNTSSSFDSALKKSYNEILKFFQEREAIHHEDSKKLTYELLEICNNNVYLNKIGISLMFTNLFKSDKLEKYINEKKQRLFLVLCPISFAYNFGN